MSEPDPSTPKAATSLIAFRPPELIQHQVIGRGNTWQVHRIEDGVGPVNLDNYRIQILKMPEKEGLHTMEGLLKHIRLNINAFMERNTCRFLPYSQEDTAKWRSDSPVGAVIHIDMYDTVMGISFNPEDGSVVCSEYTSDHWVFSTIDTTDDFSHPVSGNRQFGFYIKNNESFLYTRAADRVSKAIGDTWASDAIFRGGHRTWLGFQRKIVSFVAANGGAAVVKVPASQRYDWAIMKNNYHNSKVKWVEKTKMRFQPKYLGGGAYLGEDGIIRQGPGPKL